MTNKITRYGILFVIFGAILWSFDGILRTQLRLEISATRIIFWEHALASIVLIPVLFWKWKEIKSLKPNQWMVVALIALFSSVLGTVFFTAAFGLISFSTIVLLQQLQPIFAISGARIILKEKTPPHLLLWATIAIIGSYLIAFGFKLPSLEGSDGPLIAYLFPIFAALSWGLGTSLGRLILNQVTVPTSTALRFSLGAIFSLILLFTLSQFYNPITEFVGFPISDPEPIFTLTSEQFRRLALIVAFTGLGAVWIYYYGLKRTPAKIATLGELFWPASALIIDTFYNIETQEFGYRPEIITIGKTVGILLLIISITMISRKAKEGVPK